MPVPNSTETVHPIYVVKLWRMGRSNCVPLHLAVMAALGLTPGALVVCRVHPPYITLRLAKPERLIPIDDFAPEDLPPSWPGKDDNATSPNDCESAVAGTTRTPTRKYDV